MQPTTLRHLISVTKINSFNYGLEIQTQSSWVVPGESHLSYTTLTRLVECCREHHWQSDVVPYIASPSLDSICKSINARFLEPVPVSAIIKILYKVNQVRNKGYELLFRICNVNQQNIFAIYNIVLVFYDTKTNKITAIPDSARSKLTELRRQAGVEERGDVRG